MEGIFMCFTKTSRPVSLKHHPTLQLYLLHVIGPCREIRTYLANQFVRHKCSDLLCERFLVSKCQQLQHCE